MSNQDTSLDYSNAIPLKHRFLNKAVDPEAAKVQNATGHLEAQKEIDIVNASENEDQNNSGQSDQNHSQNSESRSNSMDNGDGESDAESNVEQDEEAMSYRESSEASESDSSDEETNSKQSLSKKSSHELLEEARMDPELYGLRRSGRSRQPVHRFVEDSDDDSDYPQARKRKQSSKARKTSRTTSFVKKHVSDDDELSESDADGDYYEGRRTKRRRAPARKRRVDSDSDSDFGVADQVRFSTRSRGVKNYNEDARDAQLLEEAGFDEEELADMEAEEVKRTKKEPQGDYFHQESETSVIGSVWDARPDFESVSRSQVIHDYSFFIKWRGKSHLRCTWETYSALQNLPGVKKVQNFFADMVLSEIRLEVESKLNPNRRDELEDMRVKRQELIETHKERCTVQRVVASDGDSYLVQWTDMPYRDCTWESRSFLLEHVPDMQLLLDEIHDRANLRTLPHHGKQWIRDRPKFAPIKNWDWVPHDRVLHKYQGVGVSWLLYMWTQQKNGVLADEMGLGKTIQTISFLYYLFKVQKMYGPFLIVVPLSTVLGWTKEFKRWAPEMNLIQYLGDNESRSLCREFEWFTSDGQVQFHALLTTYDYILKDVQHFLSFRWQFLVVDEAHRLKNDKSQAYEKLVSLDISNKLLITGTPIQNSVEEMLALMRFLNPAAFSDVESFDLRAGDESTLSSKIQALRERLSGYVLRRLKRDVATELPPKTELIIRVPLSQSQRALSQAIVQRNWAMLTRMKSDRGTLHNIAMELRKASNHPFLLQSVSELDNSTFLARVVNESGKFYVLDQLLAKLRSEHKRVLLFSQSLGILDLIERYLSIKRVPYQRLDGSTSSDERCKRIEHFNAPESVDFLFMLSTRAGGLGINLETADTVIIFDSDWNPQNDLQAMARAHRIGQKKEVRVYRLVSADSIDEKIIERAKQKIVLEYAIMSMDTSGAAQLGKNYSTNASKQTLQDLEALLKFGVQELFQANEGSHPKDSLTALDINELIQDAEKVAADEDLEQRELDPQREFKKQFEIMDLADKLDWETVVPDTERAQLDAAADEHMLAAQAPEDLGIRRAKYAFLENSSSSSLNSDTPSSKRPSRSRKAAEQFNKDATTFEPFEIKAVAKTLVQYGYDAVILPKIAKLSHLEHKSFSMLASLINELVEACRDFAAKLASKDAAGETEKFSFRGATGLNPALIASRVDELGPLMRALYPFEQAPGGLAGFRVNQKVRPVNHWDAKWGVRDDAALLVGVYKHGFGNWKAIAADKDLKLEAKFFLESAAEKKLLPSSQHLSRRVDYLIKLLAESAPVPGKRRSGGASRKPAVDAPKPSSTVSSVSEESEYESMDESELKSLFHVKKATLKSLKQLRGDTPKQRANNTLKGLLELGDFIADLSRQRKSQLSSSEMARFEKHCWKFVSYFWPHRPIKAEKIHQHYLKRKKLSLG